MPARRRRCSRRLIAQNDRSNQWKDASGSFETTVANDGLVTTSPRSIRMNISYLIHDIGHPDLSRRLGMLRQGGAQTTVLGFRRRWTGEAAHADAVIDLGETINARFVHRIWAVARAVPRLSRSAGRIASSRVILARNLEMLFLAAVARRRYAPRAALVYECLDIHQLMLSKGAAGAVLRRLERRLLARSQALIVSSPGFLREYFQPTHRVLPKTFLVENKVFPTENETRLGERKVQPGPPWRIGWFGMLRCRRSLEILLNVARSLPGRVEVILAGRFSPNVFGNLNGNVPEVAGVTFLGSYKEEPADLMRLFGSVHFTWAIDFYEAGANSAWLLPNRLYRAMLYGSVPLAMADVETGRWLAGHGTGILLREPLANSLADMVRGMTPEKLADAQAALRRVSRSALVFEAEECRDLVRALGELRQ